MTYKQQVMDAYYQMVQRVMNAGYDPYIITLMFNQMPGNARSIAQAMERETERTYTRLLTRIIKKPANLPIDCMPLLLASPDWPVPKYSKISHKDAIINDGRHIQGIFLVPPINRMKKTLVEIVTAQQSFFAGPVRALSLLRVDPIDQTPEKAFRYVMKSVSRLRIGDGDIILLPKAHSEMSRDH